MCARRNKIRGNIAPEMKSAVVTALDKIKTYHPQAFKPILPQTDFESRHTRKLFTALDIPQHFLTISPDMRENDNDYIVSQRKVRSLKAVNDVDERKVVWIQEFNSCGKETVLVASKRNIAMTFQILTHPRLLLQQQSQQGTRTRYLQTCHARQIIEEEDQSHKLALRQQPWVWSVSDFILLATAYVGGWHVLSLTVSSFHWQIIDIMIISVTAWKWLFWSVDYFWSNCW